MAFNWVSIVRFVYFVITILLSIILTSLSADIMKMTAPYYYAFSVLALVTGPLTILPTTSVLIIDHFCQGSIVLYIGVEIAWLQILWILWLITGSYAAWENHQLISQHSYLFPDEISCNFGYESSLTQLCHKIQVFSAFAFFLVSILIGHTVMLLVLVFRARRRGHSAWKTSVRDADFLYPAEKTTESFA